MSSEPPNSSAPPRTAGDAVSTAPGTASGTTPGEGHADIDTLVAEGHYADAAARARALGAFDRAAELYERIWEFDQAAQCARQAGDLGRALDNALDARDETLIITIAAELDARGESGQRAAMDSFARKRRFGDAARRAEALGELERAIELYRSDHMDLDAARLYETMGKDRDAGRLLERLLEVVSEGPERAETHLRLGLLLVRHMSYELAAQHLQEAGRHPVTCGPARRALVVTLVALGLRDAAREVLREARREDDSLPADIDAFVRMEREATAAAQAWAQVQPSGPGAGAAPGPGAGAGPDEREQVVGGRYRLQQLLGAGSSGRVFRARDEVTGRPCAVKLLHITTARASQAYERFVREARLAGTLRHPNLIELFDSSAEQGYMVMELMDGGSLAERLASGPMSGPAVRRMAVELLAGLELAHQRGVIHRDIKPDNIFFDARGTAKLGDFGVAHLLDLGQTQTGGLIGTLAYMAPEQITGAPLTIAADLYALGITLFQALAGRLPFLGPDFVAQHLGETPPALAQVAAQAAARWGPIAGRLLAKSPDERYPSIEELRRAILELDLGDADRPAMLVLHRPDAAPGPTPAPAAGPRADPSAASAPDSDLDIELEHPAGQAHAGALRYQYETPLRQTANARLSRAVDSVLERSVVIERYQDGLLDQASERRLYALARSSGPFLQRVLAYDRAAGVVVYEAPSGVPVAEAFTAAPLGARPTARLLKRLARAVGPLHDSGHAHGAIDPTTVVVDDQLNPTLLVCGLGPVASAAAPAQDIEAIVALAAGVMAAPAGAGDATARLVTAMLPDADAATRAQLLARGPGQHGEELYQFADTLEIAVLAGQVLAVVERGLDHPHDNKL